MADFFVVGNFCLLSFHVTIALEMRDNMKKKDVFTLFVFLVIILGLFFIIKPTIFPKDQQKSAEKETFFILSDPHFLAPELHDEGKAFSLIKRTAAGKDLDYQKESLEAFVTETLKKKPAGVIITGDLTLNGEKISAEVMKKILSPLKKAGISLYTLPGNHDIHDGWARKYQGDKQEKTAQISPKDFKNIFSDGYEESLSQAPEDLSYSLKIQNNYRFIMLDSNLYSLDDSTSQPTTAGKIRASTLTWLEKQLQEAKEKKQKVLIFTHHNVLRHNPLVYQGFVLNNTEEVQKLLQKYHVPVIFSGHIHAQDIMTENKMTEIVTSSYGIIDHGYGELTLSKDKLNYERKTISVSTWAKENKDLPSDLKETLLNHDNYLEKLFYTDGERLAYQDLLDKGIYDKKILDPVANLVAKGNVNYFKGADFLSDEEVANIKLENGYQLLKEHSEFLKEYVDFILQDKNLPDQNFSYDY